MSNDYPGDEPTRAYRPFDADNADATRLEHSVPRYDPEREPAGNPYPTPPTDKQQVGIAAQLVTVGLVCLFIGLGLGYFLFRNVGGGSNTTDETTTTVAVTSSTTSSTTSTTSSTTSTTAVRSTTTTERSTTTTTRPTTTTTRASTTTTTQPTTTTTAATNTN